MVQIDGAKAPKGLRTAGRSVPKLPSWPELRGGQSKKQGRSSFDPAVYEARALGFHPFVQPVSERWGARRPPEFSQSPLSHCGIRAILQLGLLLSCRVWHFLTSSPPRQLDEYSNTACHHVGFTWIYVGLYVAIEGRHQAVSGLFLSALHCVLTSLEQLVWTSSSALSLLDYVSDIGSNFRLLLLLGVSKFGFVWPTTCRPHCHLSDLTRSSLTSLAIPLIPCTSITYWRLPSIALRFCIGFAWVLGCSKARRST
jgi:hypothetical protein